MTLTGADLINFIMLYAVLWWVVLFTVLPYGVKRDDSPETGNSTGAPQAPLLKKKLILTSLITLPVTLLLMVAARYFRPY